MSTLAERGVAAPGVTGTAKNPIVKSAHASNYGSRKNTPVDTLVIHVTQSQRNAAAITARAPPSAVIWFGQQHDGPSSAHYVISSDGLIYACVPEGFCAWHAGNAGINRRSIGIEIEGWVEKADTFNPEAMAALVTLSADLVTRHGIPFLRQPGPGICGHMDVPDPKDQNRRGGSGHHTDPGPLFSWDLFFRALRGELAARIA